MCAPDTAVPFFHLKSDGFWHLHANEGYESKLSRARKLRAVSRIHELISHVTLDDELFVCWLMQVTERSSARRLSAHIFQIFRTNSAV